ncbi:MAG: tetratricopeptide repeat protein [Chloroflexi bacterium]|nr:tetratricopeptide repeat protein [Chloroflexota bacterium]
MPANVDGMVREGVSAYRAGRKDEARAFLLKAVELDERNEQAWLWLSAVVESVDEQRICLENVLAINPNNERALQGIRILNQKGSPPAPSKADDVLASVSFTPVPPPAPPPAPPKPAPSSPPPAASPFSAGGAADDLPDIQWDEAPTATSSASSTRRVNEPSAVEYDDWVNSLNLGGGNTLLQELGADFEMPSAMDDMAKLISAPSVLDDDDEDLFGGMDALPAGDPFGGPFSAAETNLPPEIAPRPAAPKPQPVRAAVPPKSDALLDKVEEEEADEFISDFDDYDRATLDATDPSEMFRYIPTEITATRLPGTRERYPVLVVLALLVGVVLNVGAAALLVSRLTGG